MRLALLSNLWMWLREVSMCRPTLFYLYVFPFSRTILRSVPRFMFKKDIVVLILFVMYRIMFYEH